MSEAREWAICCHLICLNNIAHTPRRTRLSSVLTIRLSCIIVVAIIRILNLFLSFANYQRIKMSIMLSII